MLHRLFIILLTGLLLTSCTEPEPLRIGFLGSLSGRASDVSQAARDGAILAVEQINNRGGIDGRQLELVVFDDQHDPERAAEGVRTLAGKEVAAIVGPITSQMAIAALPEANKHKVLLVSPTATTTELNDKVDFFYRIYPTCELNARRLARYAVEKLGKTSFAIICDLSNKAFTDAWQLNFSQQAEKLGARIIKRLAFDSLEQNHSYHDIAQSILEDRPQGVLVLANSIDTALFIQQIVKLGGTELLLGSDWAFSGDLVAYGGKSVEGFTFTTNIDMTRKTPEFISFKEKFQQRFAFETKFPAILGYEATQVILRGLEQGEEEKLIETINGFGQIKGLQGTFRFNRFGDVLRTSYINMVEDGQFTTFSTID